MKTNFYLLTLLLILLTSCVTLYVPTPHNSPMFSKKNEFQAAASMGTGLNLRTAYSFSNHWGVTATYLHADDRVFNQAVEGNQWRRHNVGEIGLGYYRRSDRNFYMDFFAGAGLGKGIAENTITTSDWSIFFPGSEDQYKGKVSYSKFYIQPSIGFSKRIFSWGASLRVTYVNFTHAHVTMDDEQILFGEKPDLLLSSAGEFRVAIIKDKLYGSAQGGLMLASQRDEEFFYYSFISLSAGIMFKL